MSTYTSGLVTRLERVYVGAPFKIRGTYLFTGNSANDGNSTILREADSQKANCEKIKSLPLPKTPTLQFISGTNRDNERWVDSHREMTDASSHGRMVQLDCGHYVHHYESEKIAKEIRSFLSELKK